MGFFSWVLYIAIALLALMLMITIHEAGHYSAGKMLGFKIEEFAIGFGKPIFKKTKQNGEVFSIRMLPLGGFCQFEGEDEDKPASSGAFNNQKVWKRLIVLFFGPFFNFLSAILFSFILLMSFGYADVVQITNVTLPQGVPAETWLMKGDIITAVNGVNCDFVTDSYFEKMHLVYDYGNGVEGDSFTLTVKRGNEYKDILVYKSIWATNKSQSDTTYGKLYTLDGTNYNYAVKKNTETEKTEVLKINNSEVEEVYVVDDTGFVTIGDKLFKIDSDNLTISSATIGINTSYYRYGFFEGLGYSFIFCFKWVWKILLILWQLFSFQLPITSLGGTVTTIVTVAEATHRSFANLLLLFPLISINLAVFNLLPFPALDGARMVFVGIEGIRRKPVNRKVEGMIHMIGLIVLFLFVIVVDILHFVL